MNAVTHDLFAPDARAARTVAVPIPGTMANRRAVRLGLTDFAPGCVYLRIGDRRRWPTLWAVEPVAAMRKILTRLSRLPGDVRAEMQGDDIALIAEVDGLGVDDGPQPLALIWDGLTLAETLAALDQLKRDAWAPPVVIAPPPFAP